MINNLYSKPSTYILKVFDENVWWNVNLTHPILKEKYPDCQIIHPRRRFSFRTQKGLKARKYNNLNELVYDIWEEGIKFDIKFTKFKILKNTTGDKRKIIKFKKITRKIEVTEMNIKEIIRIICDSNNIYMSYDVFGEFYNKSFLIAGVLRKPVPLVTILNKKNNFNSIKNIVLNNYGLLHKYDYKNRGYDFFTNDSPNIKTGGFLVPLLWFERIEYLPEKKIKFNKTT
ncbi:MAG: hypothetical protein ACOCRX_05370 [Candidatus Woesearchaeota archaeon]